MFVSDWMTRKVFTVAPDDGISDAIRLLKEKKIKHIPVVRENRLKGIISDRDIKEFSPSAASTLDVYELHYLLAKTKVKEVMKSKVRTTSPDTPIEEAARIMHDFSIGCLPVMEDDRIVGIISDRDIFHALVDITGVRHGGHRIFMPVPDRSGSVKDVADIIRKHGFQLQSILTSYEKAKEGYRNIVIRTSGKGQFGAMKAELQGTYQDVRIKKG
ncbi:MAG: CBS and ACT domain-containing protein [Nitrospiraceae bacterium]|nr:CBS and ACT domain-containing protein [Nitrospiraceae bacterium]